MCYFSVLGSKIEYDYLKPNIDGVYPTYVDGNQIFHYTFGGNLNAIKIASSNLNDAINIDQYKNFNVKTEFNSTLTLYSNSVTYTTVPYTASTKQQAIMKYDKNYNIIWYTTVQNSNVCIFTTIDDYFNSYAFGCSLIPKIGSTMTSNFFTIPTNETQGLVVSSNFTSNITCSSSNVFIDSVKISTANNVYVSGRTTASGPIRINGTQVSTSPSGGVAFIAKFLSNGTLSYLNQLSNSNVSLETSLSLDLNSNPIVTYYTNSNMTITKYGIWNVLVSNLQNTNQGTFYNKSKDVFDNTYILSKFVSTSPTLPGHTIVSGTGNVLLKIDKNGNVRFTMTFIGSGSPIMFIDRIIGVTFINFKESTGNVNVYRENTLVKSSLATPCVLGIDGEGNIFDSNISPVVSLSDFFSTLNNVYREPFYDVSYFFDPYIAAVSNVNATLGSFDGTNWIVNLSWDAVHTTQSNVYYKQQNTPSYTFWTKTATTSNIFKATPEIWFSNTYTFKIEVNGVFNTPPLPFATTTLTIPKNPTYANVSSISATLGTFSNPYYQITVDWSSAVDFLYANVYYRAQDTLVWTFYTQKNSPTTSNVINITPNYDTSNTYSFKVEVYNTNNTTPLPFATTTLSVPKYPNYATISSISATLGTFSNPYYQITVDWSSAVDFLYANVYYRAQDTLVWTFYTQKNSPTTSNVINITPNYDTSNTYSFKVEVYNTNNTTPLPFATTTLSVPKYPNYATISSVNTTLGYYSGKSLVYTSWSAQDFATANVYYKKNYESSYTLYSSVSNTSSNVIVLNTTGSDTYNIKVEVSNVFNTQPLPFATTNQFVTQGALSFDFTRQLNGSQVSFVTTDSTSNVYFSGSYSGTPTITTENGTSVATLPTASGTTAAFISKFNSSNSYVFSRVLDPATSTSIDSSSSNVFLSGYYSGSNSVLGPGSLASLTRPNSGYVISLDSNGSYNWNILVDNVAQCSTVLSSGYVAGFNTSNASNVYDSTGSVVTKFQANSGFCINFNQNTGVYTSNILISNSNVYSVAVDSTSNVYLSGYKYTTNAIGSILPATTGFASFMVKYNSYSVVLESSSGAVSTILEGTSNVYFIGTCSSGAVLKNSSGSVIKTLPSTSSDSAYLIKLDAQTGNFLYARLITPGSGAFVKVNTTNGNVYISGRYSGSSAQIIDENGTILSNLTNCGGTDNVGFIIAFDINGNYDYYSSSFVNTNVNDTIQSIAFSQDRMYVSGYSV